MQFLNETGIILKRKARFKNGSIMLAIPTLIHKNKNIDFNDYGNEEINEKLYLACHNEKPVIILTTKKNGLKVKLRKQGKEFLITLPKKDVGENFLNLKVNDYLFLQSNVKDEDDWEILIGKSVNDLKKVS